MIYKILSFLRKVPAINSLLGIIGLATKHHGEYKYVNVIDLDEAKKNNIITPITILKKKQIQIFGPEYYINSDYTEISKTDSIVDSTLLIKINNGLVIGASNVIGLSENLFLYNHNSGIDINYSDGAFVDYRTKYNIGYRTRIYLSKRPIHSVDRAITFCINYNFNYYHYVFECLSKFYLLAKTNIDNSIPIIIDSTVKDIPQFNELLQIFNKDNREIIYISRRQRLLVGTLYAFTPTLILPVNYKDYSIIKADWIKFNPDIIKYLRETILSKYTIKQNGQSKIYISRAGNKLRSYNDDEVRVMLESLGYTTIYPERLTIEEQVAAFYNANVVIAASGAALTNIIFCKPRTTIIVLTSHKIDLSIFSSIAQYLNLNMIYLVADKSSSASLHSDFYFNPQKLKETIQSIISYEYKNYPTK